jgi:hypothetical protein
LSAADTGAATDATTSPVNISVSESGTGTDDQVLTVFALDSVIGADTAINPNLILGADTGAGTDAVATTTVAGSDYGVLTDTEASIAVTLQVSDSGNLADACSLSAAVSGEDSGSSLDTSTGFILVSASDSGTGLDTCSLEATLVAYDFGNASDYVTAVDDVVPPVINYCDFTGNPWYVGSPVYPFVGPIYRLMQGQDSGEGTDDAEVFWFIVKSVQGDFRPIAIYNGSPGPGPQPFRPLIRGRLVKRGP